MKIAVLGCGNMASALIIPMRGKIDICTYTPSKVKAIKLASKVNGQMYETISDLPDCDFYMIGCKPQQFEELAKELKGKIPENSVIISLMAGVSVDYICTLLSHGPVVRTMPNTPSLVGKGVLALYANPQTSTTKSAEIIELFETGAEVYQFNSESKIDDITPFSGSGPAYIFEFARILTDKMTSMGVDADIAKKMIAETFAGAAEMLVTSKDSFEELRNNVTSKNGVTYEALKVFKDESLQDISNKAIDMALKRVKELKK